MGENEFQFQSIVHTADGHTHILRTDSKEEFISCLLKDLLEEYGVQQPEVSVKKLEEDWMRVEIRFDPTTMNEDDAINLYGDLNAALGGGKGWYECLKSGESEGNCFWWICRHIGGPYI